MIYIATAALVELSVIAGCIWALTRAVVEFLSRDDFRRIANSLAFPRAQDVLVELCQADRDLLANFRRRKPKAKELA
jgi:hypothetical protein